jgi:hypothetical protein
MLRSRYALRSVEDAQEERQKERDQHRDDVPASTTRRRKHPYRRTPRRVHPSILLSSALPPQDSLILIGEARLPWGMSAQSLARDLCAQIADMGVTLDVLVEPVDIDMDESTGAYPSIRFYVEREEAVGSPSEVLPTQFRISSLLSSGRLLWRTGNSRQ